MANLDSQLLIMLPSGAAAPGVAFSGTPTSGQAPLSVSFTDLSSGSPTSWSWDFGDTGTSTSQNPTHSYASAGTYSVKLTATNANGSRSTTKNGYIVVSVLAPVAAFTASPIISVAPVSVQFTDQSSNLPTSWLWNFGDGTTSTSQNPKHQYTTTGLFTISLTATNAGGSNSLTKTAYLRVFEGHGAHHKKKRKEKLPYLVEEEVEPIDFGPDLDARQRLHDVIEASFDERVLGLSASQSVRDISAPFVSRLESGALNIDWERVEKKSMEIMAHEMALFSQIDAMAREEEDIETLTLF